MSQVGSRPTVAQREAGTVSHSAAALRELSASSRLAAALCELGAGSREDKRGYLHIFGLNSSSIHCGEARCLFGTFTANEFTGKRNPLPFIGTPIECCGD